MAHVSSVFQYNGTTDKKSKPTFFHLRHPFLFLCLITCLFAPLHASFPLLACLVCFLSASYTCFFAISFACLLALGFLCLLHVHAWSIDTNSKTKAQKGKM